MSKKAKYKIVEHKKVSADGTVDETHYTIHKQFMFLFWKTYTEVLGSNYGYWDSDVKFESIEKAIERIHLWHSEIYRKLPQKSKRTVKIIELEIEK